MLQHSYEKEFQKQQGNYKSSDVFLVDSLDKQEELTMEHELNNVLQKLGLRIS